MASLQLQNATGLFWRIGNFETNVEAMKSKPYPILQNISEALHFSDAEISYESVFTDRIRLVKLIETGLAFSDFNILRSSLPFNNSEWATYLNVSVKSLQRYEKESQSKFKPSHSEKIIELAEVAFRGIEVFGSVEDFATWLKTPSPAFNHQTPNSLLVNSYGKELVLDTLGRIEHGIFS